MKSSYENREQCFSRLRAEWFKVMRPLGAWFHGNCATAFSWKKPARRKGFWGQGLIHPAPQLRQENLRHCLVFPNRSVLLKHLPANWTIICLALPDHVYCDVALRRMNPNPESKT